MTTHLIARRIPGPPGHTSPFTAESHALLDRFDEELAASGSGPPFPTAVLLASDFLIEVHGEDGADWRHFELGAFLAFLAQVGPTFLLYAARMKETLTAFLAFLERRGRVERGMAEQASLVPLPHGLPPLEALDCVSGRVPLLSVPQQPLVTRRERRQQARAQRRTERRRHRQGRSSS